MQQEIRVKSPGERSAFESSASTNPRLRPATLDDTGAVLSVAVTSGLFPPDEVAHIPDFYSDGDSKVVFAKRIDAQVSA